MYSTLAIAVQIAGKNQRCTFNTLSNINSSWSSSCYWLGIRNIWVNATGVVDVHSSWLHSDGQRGEEKLWSREGMWWTSCTWTHAGSLLWPPHRPVEQMEVAVKAFTSWFYLPAVFSVRQFILVGNGSATTEMLCRWVNKQQQYCSLFIESYGISIGINRLIVLIFDSEFGMPFSSSHKYLRTFFITWKLWTKENNSIMNNEILRRLWQTVQLVSGPVPLCCVTLRLTQQFNLWWHCSNDT